MGVDHYKSVEGFSVQVAAALLAYGVHARGYMLEGRYEGRVRRGHPDVGAEAGQARHQGSHAVLADAPGRNKARAGVGDGVKKAFAKAAAGQVHAGRAVKVGRSGHNGPAGDAAGVVEDPGQGFAQGYRPAWLQRQRGGDFSRVQSIGGFGGGGFGAGGSSRFGQPAGRLARLFQGEGRQGRGVLHRFPHREQGFMEAGLYGRRRGFCGAVAGHLHPEAGFKIVQGGVVAFRGESVAGPVRGAALDAVLPAFDRPVNYGGRLRIEAGGELLRAEDLEEVVTVLDVDHVPVVQVGQLARGPLHVIAGFRFLGADVIGIYGGLVPVHVHDQVGKLRRGGGRHRLGDAARGKPALALQHVDLRAISPVNIGRGQGQPGRSPGSHPRRPRRQLDERNERRGMAVQRFRIEFPEQGGFGGRAAAETQQVLQAELVFFRRQFRPGRAQELRAQRPEGVHAQGLVARGVGEDVVLLPLGVEEIVGHRGEEERLGDAARGNAAARVAGKGSEVVKDGAEGAVNEVYVFQGPDVGVVHLEPGGHYDVGDLVIAGAPLAERELGGLNGVEIDCRVHFTPH